MRRNLHMPTEVRLRVCMEVKLQWKGDSLTSLQVVVRAVLLIPLIVSLLRVRKVAGMCMMVLMIAVKNLLARLGVMVAVVIAEIAIVIMMVALLKEIVTVVVTVMVTTVMVVVVMKVMVVMVVMIMVMRMMILRLVMGMSMERRKKRRRLMLLVLLVPLVPLVLMVFQVLVKNCFLTIWIAKLVSLNIWFPNGWCAGP